MVRSLRGLAAEPGCESGSPRSCTGIPANTSAFSWLCNRIPAHPGVFSLLVSLSLYPHRTLDKAAWCPARCSGKPRNLPVCNPSTDNSIQRFYHRAGKLWGQMGGISLGSGPPANCAALQFLMEKEMKTVRMFLKNQDAGANLSSVCRL